MGKIVQITDEIITIGLENGELTEVRPSDLNFTPVVGDEVSIFGNESKTIVTKLEKEVAADPTANMGNGGININVQNSQTNSQPQQVYVANGQRAVNKLVYCLLAFFLGGLGVHKFYVGKIGQGILYVVFCWTYVPAFIAFVEFIIAICKKSDAHGNILV